MSSLSRFLSGEVGSLERDLGSHRKQLSQANARFEAVVELLECEIARRERQCSRNGLLIRKQIELVLLRKLRREITGKGNSQ